MVLIVAQVLATANKLAMVPEFGLALVTRREKAKEEQERHRAEVFSVWRES